MAGDTSTKSGWQQSLATANRLRPVVVALLAVALVGVFPAHHKDTRNQGAAKKSDVATTGGPDAATSTAAAPAGQAPAAATPNGQAPTGGATAGAGLNRATTATTAAKAAQGRSTAKVGAVAAGAVAAPPAPTGAGLNTPPALAEPTCDPKTKRLKVSFTRAAPCAVAWPKGADNGGATTTGVTATSIKVVIYNPA